MPKYLKLFDTHAEYTAYLGEGEMILPNVSHCIDQNDVHYNPYVRPNLCYRSVGSYYVLCDNKGRLYPVYDHDRYFLGWNGSTTKLFHNMAASGNWEVISDAVTNYGVAPNGFNISTTFSNNITYLKNNKFTWEGTDYVFNNGTWTPSLPGGQFIDPNEEIHGK